MKTAIWSLFEKKLTEIGARYKVILLNISWFLPFGVRVLVCITCLTTARSGGYARDTFLNSVHVVAHGLLLIASCLLRSHKLVLFHRSLLHRQFLAQLLLWGALHIWIYIFAFKVVLTRVNCVFTVSQCVLGRVVSGVLLDLRDVAWAWHILHHSGRGWIACVLICAADRCSRFGWLTTAHIFLVILVRV